jgi:hypothetical protein
MAATSVLSVSNLAESMPAIASLESSSLRRVRKGSLSDNTRLNNERLRA